MKQKDHIPTVNVLDIPLFNGGIPDLFELISDDIQSGDKQNRQVSFCDANVLISSKKDPDFKAILQNDTFINLPDGMPGVWIGKMKGAKGIDRCYGPDVFEYVFKNTAGRNINHYFTGGKVGVAGQLKDFCSSKFKNDNVKGTHCPPFRDLTEEEIKEIAADINAKNADIVWVGISSPKQDKYAKRLSRYTNVHFLFTVGAAFDFFTGNVKQAPKFIQRSGFEWLFRLCMEPKRLWKRYVRVVPLFFYYNILSFIKLRKNFFT